MSHTNFIFTLWKLAVPILVIILFMAKKFETGNLTAFGGFAPQGAHGVFSSLAVGGIILAFNGFQPGIALAGETKNPKKNIPIAIIGSLLICITIYCLLQLSFLTAIPKEFLKEGWSNLSFSQEAGPLAGLSFVLGVFWLAKFLYIDAIVSPMGSAIVFFAAAARASFAMSKGGFLPKFFQKTTKKGIPIFGILFNFLISILIFLVFSGWQEMAAFYAAAICLCNSFIPLILVALRRQSLKNNYLESSFQIPCYKLFTFCAFYISNLMLYWCGWNMIMRLDFVILIGFLFMVFGYLSQKKRVFKNIRSTSTFFIFIFSISILSKLGSYGNGLGIIGLKGEFFCVFCLSFIVYFISSKLCLTNEETFVEIQQFDIASLNIPSKIVE